MSVNKWVSQVCLQETEAEGVCRPAMCLILDEESGQRMKATRADDNERSLVGLELNGVHQERHQGE